MHVIIYSSKARCSQAGANEMVAEIVTTAKSRNAALSVTGVLLFQSGYFLQAIEGDEKALRRLYESIKTDPRHSDINLHVDQPIEERSFDKWQMDAFTIDTSTVFDSEAIGIIQRLYDKTFEMNPRALIEFIKTIVDEVDTFKIQSDLQLRATA